MPNVIRFEIETEAPYSKDEKEALLDSFLTFMQEEDPDVVEGTEEIEIVPSGTPKAVITEEQKRAIVDELLQKATVSGGVTLSFDGETVLRAELNLV